MDEKRLLDGLYMVEGLVLPSTPPNGRDETRRASSNVPSNASSHQKDEHLQGVITADYPGRPVYEGAQAAARKLPSSVAEPPVTSAGPTIAFLLQLQPTFPNSMTAAVLPQSNLHQPKPIMESRSLTQREVLKLPQAIHDELTLASTETMTPHALRKVLLMLTFNSPASTMTALAKLHAAALVSQGRTTLAALQPVPLVARIFADAVAADDISSSERAAVVLLTLLAKAQLPLSDDVAGSLVIPSALRLLGGSAAAAAQASATTAAAAAAAVASGALSSSSLLLRLHPQQQHPQPGAVTALPQLSLPHTASAAATAPPWTSRLAAARLLLHLITVGPLPPEHNQCYNTSAAVGRRGATRPPGQPSASPAAFRDRLVAAGGLEACAEALAASVMVCPELQLAALQILAALTADVTGWPWNWPVVRAAAVEGCARHAVAVMQLLGGGGSGVWADLEGEVEGDDGAAGSEVAAHAAARDIVVHLARGPLLVRQALVRAGVLAPVVQAIMLWPPPAQPQQPQSSPVAAAARLHFSLCLGVLLQLSSLPGVRVLLASPGLGPLLGHLLDLMEQQGATAGITGSVGRSSMGPGASGIAGPGSRRTASGFSASGSDGGYAEVRGPLLELLLNLALDPSCHGGLAAMGVERMLVRCIAAGQQLRLGPELGLGSGKRPGSESPGAGQQQSWRSAAALRLMAALAADTRFSLPQTAMQRALAGFGGLEVVAEEVRHAAEGLPVPAPSTCAPHPATIAYELGLTALCALLTGNGELQRRVAEMSELLTALAAALAAPVVMRSDALLRLTLAAWRLITAPLAAPDADPATARQLLISLGYNADLLPDPAAGGGAAGLYGSAQEVSSARSQDHRHSILLAAAEMFTGHRSSSDMGGTLCPASFDVTGAGVGSTGRAMQLYRCQAASDQEGRLEVTTAGAGDGGRNPGPAGVPAAVGMSAPVWTGPLLPGMPLPPPGAPPPNVAPLRLPSCISNASATAAVLAVDGRPGSNWAGGKRSASGTGFRHPASRDAQRSGSSLSGKPSQLAANNEAQQASRALPHQIVFVSADSDDERKPLGATAICRPGSGRIMSTRLTASPLSPGTIQVAAAAAASKAGASDPAPLPGSLLTLNGAQEGLMEPNRADSRAPVEDLPFPTATFEEPDSLRHPSASTATLHASFINSSGTSVGPGSRPLSSLGAAAAGSVGSGPSSPSCLQRRQAASVGAAAAVSTATGELPPPLLCLVSHLQGLLRRPGAGSGAALVLVQLARLEVLRRSAVVAAGWGELMEAVTCSLTGGAAEEQLAGPLHTRAPGPACGLLPIDPRDQLALLEAMAVAAGSAPDGRAALTSDRVVTALTELACGVGSLASSLTLGRQGLGPTAQQRMKQPDHSHLHSSRHSYRHLARSRGVSGSLLDTQDVSGPGAGPGDRVQPQRHGEGQGLLLRARTLASSILADLMPQHQVTAHMEEGRVGAILAEQQLAALTEAAEAASGPLLDSTTAATLAAAAGGSSHMATGEQQRQRNAAARLLRQLAEHIECARNHLARPVVVAGLLELLEEMWSTYGPSLAPATSASVLPRLTTATSAPMSLSRPQLPEQLTTITSRTNTNNNVSFLTLNPINAQQSSFTMDTTFLNSHPSLAPFLGPTTAATTRSGSPTTAARPQVPSPNTVGSLPLENGAVRRSITAGIVGFSGSGHGGPGGAGGVVQQLHSPMLRLGGGVGGRSADSPHGVATRMSLHAAACSDGTSWTTHAQQAMKALEMTEERLVSPAPPNPFMRLHAHTHAGFTTPARQAPAAMSGPASATEGHSRGSAVQDTDAAAVEAPDSPEDSFTKHLRRVAPPPAPTVAPQPSLSTNSSASAAAGGRSLLGTVGGAARQPLPLSRLASRSLRAVEEEGGAAEADGGYEDAAGSPRDPRPDAVRGIPMLRRGTRTLAPAVSGGGCAPGLGPRAASAASAAACARELTELLRLLAEAESDAARTMCTLPAVELFVDLLGASCLPLVLASLGLLRVLARRQDAHETFWDCDAVAQLVAHLQLRSPAAVAAMTDGAAGSGSGGCGVADGGSALLVKLSGFLGDAGGSGERSEWFGYEDGMGGPAAALQLAAAQVLERLCGDPDLHSRLAATELPAALMELVRRAAEPGARPSQTGTTIPPGPGGSRPPPVPLLSCALAALASLLEYAEVRRQARERRFPLHLGVLAGSVGNGDRQVSLLAARCGDRLREDGRLPAAPAGSRLGSSQLSG